MDIGEEVLDYSESDGEGAGEEKDVPETDNVSDAEEEQHEDEEVREREAPRARAARGRPRGSTARRVSSSGRTGVVVCVQCRIFVLFCYRNFMGTI